MNVFILVSDNVEGGLKRDSGIALYIVIGHLCFFIIRVISKVTAGTRHWKVGMGGGEI